MSEKVEVAARKALETRRIQRRAMRQMAKNFKDCLDFLICPRCGSRLDREAKNWGVFAIINPFVRAHWLYQCTNSKCEFQFKRHPSGDTGPG